MPILDLVTPPLQDHRLLDSGAGAKLEEIAGWRVVRPCAQALWARRRPERDWDRAASVCHRTGDGGGRWEHRQGDPGDRLFSWTGPQAAIRTVLRFTSFGHCGAFFEQVALWAWLQELVATGPGAGPVKTANLFGYTGCASVAMAAAGAQVFHVDSAKGVLQWGRDHLQASGLPEAAVRWVHDDARGFLAFSGKRGFRYRGIYCDPPAWGHGTDKTKWSFDDHVDRLLRDAAALIDPAGGFLLVSCHTPGVQRAALETLLRDAIGDTALAGAALWSGELGIAHHGDDRLLPAGLYALASTLPVSPPAAYRCGLGSGQADR